MIKSIAKEISLQHHYLAGQEIRTIYFGGGTPSAMFMEDIRILLETIRKYFTVSPDVEITLETNPDDIRNDIPEKWKAMGINRLSIGIQAFQDDLLRAWNRSHSSSQAKEAIRISQKAGFKNITADLIYGGVGLNDEDWIENIQTIIESGIPHISCYALTVEPGTALAHQIKTGKTTMPDDEQSNRQYAILQSVLKKAGFEQYEISNFSLPGFESLHNTSYWSGIHYLGVGPSAHSFNGLSRQWNVANNIKYIDSINNNLVPMEIEILTSAQRYNESVMTGIRTSKGISRKDIKMFGKKYETYLDQQLEPYLKQGKIFINDDYWILKPEYYFFADGIASDLFYEEK